MRAQSTVTHAQQRAYDLLQMRASFGRGFEKRALAPWQQFSSPKRVIAFWVMPFLLVVGLEATAENQHSQELVDPP